LKQKEAAIKDFDDKLEKLGYHPNSKQKRSHHKRTATAGVDTSKTKSKV